MITMAKTLNRPLTAADHVPPPSPASVTVIRTGWLRMCCPYVYPLDLCLIIAALLQRACYVNARGEWGEEI